MLALGLNKSCNQLSVGGPAREALASELDGSVKVPSPCVSGHLGPLGGGGYPRLEGLQMCPESHLGRSLRGLGVSAAL